MKKEEGKMKNLILRSRRIDLFQPSAFSLQP